MHDGAASLVGRGREAREAAVPSLAFGARDGLQTRPSGASSPRGGVRGGGASSAVDGEPATSYSGQPVRTSASEVLSAGGRALDLESIGEHALDRHADPREAFAGDEP
jgi:hypothetical protein